ncbi:MAG: kstR1 [Acidimicrobiales bacterium]|nr:kstR1 [Acidimicrobiales bacterium]
MTDEPGTPQTLQEEQRATARRRILKAARQAVVEHGLDVTVDQIATAAGVGRRTVFRHFVSRDLLLNEVLEDWLRNINNGLPMSPNSGQPPQEWLVDVAAAVLGTNLELGSFYWELHGPRSRLADMNPSLYRAVLRVRIERANEIAASAWTSFGGNGEPPSWVVDVFAVQLSAFVTAFLGELSRTSEQVVQTIATSLEAAIRMALSETSGERHG